MNPTPEGFAQLATSAALCTGGTLQPVVCPDATLADRLAQHLTGEGWKVVTHRPVGEAWSALPHAIVAAERTPRTLHLVYGEAPVTPGLRRGFSALNLRRDVVLRALPGMLLWCGPQAFLDESRAAMPDLWSMRETTVKVEVEGRPMRRAPRTWLRFRRDDVNRLRDAFYDAMRRGDPLTSALGLRFAEALAASGELPGARAVVREVRERDPGCAEALVLLAEVALVEQEPAVARWALARLDGGTGDGLEARVAMARATARFVSGEPASGDFRAVAEARARVGDRGMAARATAAEADALAVEGEWAGSESTMLEALELLREVGDVEGEAALAHALADLLRHRQRLAAATEQYQLALALRLPAAPAVDAPVDPDLPRLLAERHPVAVTIRRLCLEAGVALSTPPADPVLAWTLVVERAVAVGRLGTLRRVVGLDAPERPTRTADGKPYVHLPVAPLGPRLVGRQQEIEQLHALLVGGAPTRLGRVAAVVGLGGIGKSQLVADYAASHLGEFPGGVYWFDLAGDVEGQLAQLSTRAGWTVPEAETSWKIERARSHLRGADRALIVFDNLEELDRVAELLGGRPVDRQVVVISRSEQPGFPSVVVEPLGAADAIGFLAATSGRGVEGAWALAERLGGHPLTIELVGAWLRAHPEATWQESARRIEVAGLDAPELIGDGWVSASGHSGNLRATLRVQSEALADPVRRRVVDILSWSAPVSMGRGLLAAALAVDGPTLQAALDALSQLQVLRREGDRWGMHRLVAAVRREEVGLPRDEAGEVARRVVDWFRARKDDWRDLAVFEAELDHLVAWRANAAVLGLGEEEVRLWWLGAYPDHHRRQLRRAQASLEEAWRLYRAHGLHQALLEADLELDRGVTGFGLGDLESSVELMTAGTRLRAEVLGEAHPDVARAELDLAQALMRMGREGEARELFHHAWPILERTEPVDALRLSSALALGSQLWSGDTRARHHRDLVPRIAAALGPNHPDVLFLSRVRAEVLLEAGRYREAVEVLRGAVRRSRELLGAGDSRTASLLEALGRALAVWGRLPHAVEVWAEGLTLLGQAWGWNERAPLLTTFRRDLAHGLHAMGRHADAAKVLAPAIAAHPPGSRLHDEVEATRREISAIPRPGARR